MDTLKPTNIRWWVFISMFMLTVVNYIDRAVISVCMPAIQQDLGFSPVLIGFVFSAFFWGYTLMQIPCGWLCDRVPLGKLIVGTGILWGVFQIITGIVSSSKLFILVRVLLGMSEAPIFPAGGKLQRIWLTATERGKGAGLLVGGAALGTALGAPLVAVLMTVLDSWRGALVGAGVLTIFIVLACSSLLSSTPDTNPRVNQAERDYLKKAFEEEDKAAEGSVAKTATNSAGLIAKFFRDPSFWGLCLGFLSYDIIIYGLMTWGPLYLSSTQHLNIKALGGAMFIIFIAGMLGSMLGGALSDHWQAKAAKAGRNPGAVLHKLFVVLGVLVAIAMFLLTRTTSAYIAVALLTIAVFFGKWVAGLYWSLPALIAQKQHIGVVGGAMNFTGNMGGAAIPITIGYIVSMTGSYYGALMLFVVCALAMGFLPLFISFKRKMAAI